MRKPETFWTDPYIRRLSGTARLILRWAWDNADADGRLEVSTERVTSEVFPIVDLEGRSSFAEMCSYVLEEIDKITKAGRWCVYHVQLDETIHPIEGGVYPCACIVQLRSWKKLSKPRRPIAGDLPAPPPGVLAAYEEQWGELDKDVRPSTPAAVRQREARRKAAEEVYRGWLRITERTEQSKFSPERRDKVLKRLKEGFSVEKILSATEYAHASDFLMGREGGGRSGSIRLDDLTDVCKNSVRLEKWSEAGDGDGGGADDVDEIRRRTIEANKKASGGRGGSGGRGRGGRGR